MLRGPFQHQPKRPPRQLACDHLESADVDLRFVLRIQRMEVRRRVIAPEHLNDYTVKAAECRHLNQELLVAHDLSDSSRYTTNDTRSLLIRKLRISTNETRSTCRIESSFSIGVSAASNCSRTRRSADLYC